MNRYVAGLDLGSTNTKLLVARADPDCTEVLVTQRPTPWRWGAGGRTELDPEPLVATLRELFDDAATQLTRLSGAESQVVALAASGMGETGILIDGGAHPAVPGIAWFDPRGEDELRSIAKHFGDEFPAHTGLPLGVQVTAVKLANLAAEGVALAGLRWLNLPDFAIVALGGEVGADLSLTSRTGLLDQDSGSPWAPMLSYLGVEAGFLPELLESGTPRGTASAGWLPPAFRDAVLCVAGHDHLVSALASGAVDSDRYHASLGTAEVLLRVLDAPLEPSARVRLARFYINCVRHVLPGKWVLVAGVKTGLLQSRALQLSGIVDRAGRESLDEAVMSLPPNGDFDHDAIEVQGAKNDDGVLRLTVRADGITPADLFLAVLNHGNDELAILLEAMDRELPSAQATVLTGGWAQMRSVRRARALVLPDVSVSQYEQDTAHGAAMVAARMAAESAHATPTT